MQVGKVSWGVQTFALASCSDSQGKKPRNRRTKEERRKMAESFIKRYQGSNNGNFPSLNLTHKEVGGSFYTVREVVREIIQENKVLRPGNLNSQAFNLDDCSEHLPEPIVSDNLYTSSLMTVEHSTDERKRQASDHNVNQKMDELLPSFSDHDVTSSKEEFALHLHDILVPQVIDGDANEQHCKSWHDNVDSTNEESSGELIELSGHGQNYIPMQDDDGSSLEDMKDRGQNSTKCEIDNPVGPSQPLSVSSTVGVSVAKDIKNDMQVNDANNIMHSFVERENAFKVGYIYDKLGNLSPSGHAAELHPIHSMNSTDSGSDQMSVEKAGVMDTSGLTEATVTASKNISHMPVHSDPTLNPMEMLSATTVDQKAAISAKVPIMDFADCPIYEYTNVQVEPPLISSNGLHTELVTTKSGRTSGEPGLENCIRDSNAEEKSTLDGTNSESSEASEQMENSEDNPLLAVIKGLVAAFFKFWTE